MWNYFVIRKIFVRVWIFIDCCYVWSRVIDIPEIFDVLLQYCSNRGHLSDHRFAWDHNVIIATADFLQKVSTRFAVWTRHMDTPILYPIRWDKTIEPRHDEWQTVSSLWTAWVYRRGRSQSRQRCSLRRGDSTVRVAKSDDGSASDILASN